jgi:hypothetical protein
MMSHWNHRVVRYRIPDNMIDGGETVYAFAEVYYNDDGNVSGWGPPFVHGDTQEELQELADCLLRAASQPALDVG